MKEREKVDKSVEDARLTDLARGVSAKLEEGNYKGAVRLLCSDDTLAPYTNETTQALRDKHPTTPANRRTLPIPAAGDQPLSADVAAVRRALYSFPSGGARWFNSPTS